MSVARQLILFTLLTGWLSISTAQRVRLDDSPSPRQEFSIDLAWQPHEIRRSISAMLNDQSASLPPLTAYVPGVDLRFDTRRYIGQTARIFLRLPTSIPGTGSSNSIELSWQADGQLQTGSVRPGQEALLFEGLINEPITGGVLNFRLIIESRDAADRFTLEPYYEIEIIS
jgi:hypothetical protein